MLLLASTRPLQTSGIASSAEENFTISTFQRLSNTLETGGFNERNEPVVGMEQQLFLQHPRTKQRMKMTARTTTRTIRGRDDPALVDASTHGDRKSTRLNSSHQIISYAVF